MKILSLFSGAALLLLASCGKEYNANPGAAQTISGNPLANNNGARSHEMTFKANDSNKGFYNTTWMYAGNDTSSPDRIIFGNAGDPNSDAFEQLTMTFVPFDKSSLKTYETINGLPNLNIAFSKGNVLAGTAKLYSSVAGIGPVGKAVIQYQDSTSIRGTFEGTLYRYVTGGYDSTDKMVITEGRFNAVKVR